MYSTPQNLYTWFTFFVFVLLFDISHVATSLSHSINKYFVNIVWMYGYALKNKREVQMIYIVKLSKWDEVWKPTKYFKNYICNCRLIINAYKYSANTSLIARFMGPTCWPHGPCYLGCFANACMQHFLSVRFRGGGGCGVGVEGVGVGGGVVGWG